MRRLLLVLLTLAAALGIASAGGASAQTQSHWIQFYVHMNAYSHWGVGCTVPGKSEPAYWDSSNGHCSGSMEEGRFLSHHFAHSSAVSWSWNGHGNLKVAGTDWYMSGVKPHNWFTYKVFDAIIDGVEYVSGTDAAAGHPDGPLYVDLTSKAFYSGITRQQGQVLDLQGYLRAK